MLSNVKYRSWVFRVLACCMVAVSTFAIMAWRNGDNGRQNPVRDSTDLTVNRLYDTHCIDSCIELLRSGDVVFRAGCGPDSYLLSVMNTKDKTFSHCGIVIMEDGYPFVYHSIGGEENPEERLRRDSAVTFFSAKSNLGMGIARFDLNTKLLGAVKQEVYRFYLRRTRFDLGFDLATDDRLYCSELVYKVMNRATNDTGYIGTTSAYGHRYVAIDDVLLCTHARLICKVQYK